MCGITGYYSFDQKTANELALENATQKLNKRGPNASGTYYNLSKSTGLGHRRLSIIDVSDSANQPMTTQDGKFTIVFNGEIYNYLELKQSLLSKGYQFKTTSDTEVLMNLFHLYENKCWELLNGFFTVAVYNNHLNTLHLARDKFGIKPLVYTHQNGVFYFGSEMKALLEYNIKKEIDNKSLRLFFKFNYIPTPYTIIKEVYKLEPGNYLTINSEGCTKHNFFNLPKENKSRHNTLDYKQAQNKLQELLEESVCKRLVSDVPIGTFLSGGIDSSIITALASKHKPNINSFSIGFKDNKFFDETHYARLVADKFKTNHHEYILSNDDLLNSLTNLLDYTDEPFADSSALAVNILCKQTKNHATVALSGDGADEIFAGYNKYQAEYRIQNPAFLEKIIGFGHPIWKNLPKSRNHKLGNTIRKLHKFSESINLTKKERYLQWCSLSKDSFLDQLIIDKISIDKELKTVTRYIEKEKGINDILLNDIKLVLCNDMLTKVDYMSMNNSLEVRVPFLDAKVVDFAISLPQEFKIDKSQKKKILQDSFKNILPKELYNRPKQGFEVPMLDWLKGELNTKIKTEYLNPDFLKEQNIFNVNCIDQLLKKLESNNPEDSHANVWALVVFQHWYKKHIV